MANAFVDSSMPIEPVTRIGRLSQFCDPKPPPTVRINSSNDTDIPLSTMQIRMTQVTAIPPFFDGDNIQGSDMIVVDTVNHTIQHQVPSSQPEPVYLSVLSHSPIGLGTMTPTGTSPVAWGIEIDPYGHILMCTDTPISSSSVSSGSGSGSSGSSSSGDPPETCEEAGAGIPDGPVHWITETGAHQVEWRWEGNMAILDSLYPFDAGTFECFIDGDTGLVSWIYRVTWFIGHGDWVSLAGVCVGYPLGNTFEIFNQDYPYNSAGFRTLALGPG